MIRVEYIRRMMKTVTMAEKLGTKLVWYEEEEW